jgi:glucose/mannose transport system substrate-binding protein
MLASINNSSPLRKIIKRHREVQIAVLRNLLMVTVLGWYGANAQGEPLQVFHWLVSTSEHKAVDFLAAHLAEEDIQWRDAVIPSGSGMGLLIVLKSRVLEGDAPDAAQLNGTIIGEWADLGLLQNLDTVAAAGKWDKLLLPDISAWIKPRGHVVVAPLGIHRTNTLFFNRKILNQFGMTPPRTWDDFEHLAAKLKKAGIPALAQSSEPWQLGHLFESLILAESGSAYYFELFVKKNSAAFSDPRLAHALQRLRNLKQWMATPILEQPWPQVTRQFIEGNAAMMVMGDWAKGELNAWGFATDVAFGCSASPGTADFHIYDIDTFAMFGEHGAHRAAQQKLAQDVVSAAVQNDYNQIKGSIPVLRNPDFSKMDSCSRESWKLFSQGSKTQVPSFTHRMATDETSRDAILGELHRFFMDDRITVQETQQRLVSISHTLMKIGSEHDTQDTRR